MAHVNLTSSPVPIVRPLQNTLTSPERNRTAQPFQQICFNTGVALTAIGVGDTEDMIIKYVLPEGYVYKLRSFFASVSILSSTANSWKAGSFQLPFRINASGGEIKQIFPIITSHTPTFTSTAPDPTTAGDRFYMFGCHDDAGDTAADDNMMSIEGMGLGNQWIRSVVNTVNPQWQIINTQDASDGPWTLFHYAIFDQYNIEQAEWAALAEPLAI